MRIAWSMVVLLSGLSLPAVERAWTWSEFPQNQSPAGFRDTSAGIGSAGDWKVIADSSASASPTNRAVLAQLKGENVANHFPILLFDRESYGDFQLTSQIKLVGGETEQIAGVVFHFQNESNYFVAAVNALRSNVCCYKITAGEIAPLFGVKMPVASGDWHSVKLQCDGNRVLLIFNDKEPIKLLVNGPPSGRCGFWTKSDSLAHFGDTKITFTPRDILAQRLVRDALKEYGRLLDLQIFAAPTGSTAIAVVASKEESAIGDPGGETEKAVINQGVPYYAKAKEYVVVTMPLKDRNGEPIAAVRVRLRTFTGQTEENAVIRAKPVVLFMQARVHSLEELLQ